MTPNEIATDVARLSPVGEGSVNWSTMATYCLGPAGSGFVPDDQRSSD